MSDVEEVQALRATLQPVLDFYEDWRTTFQPGDGKRVQRLGDLLHELLFVSAETTDQTREQIRACLDVHHHWSIVGDDEPGCCRNQQGAKCGWVGAKSEWRDHQADEIANRLAVHVSPGEVLRQAAREIERQREKVAILPPGEVIRWLRERADSIAERKVPVYLCSQCGERPAAMLKIGTDDGWCTRCLDEAAVSPETTGHWKTRCIQEVTETASHHAPHNWKHNGNEWICDGTPGGNSRAGGR